MKKQSGISSFALKRDTAKEHCMFSKWCGLIRFPFIFLVVIISCSRQEKVEEFWTEEELKAVHTAEMRKKYPVQKAVKADPPPELSDSAYIRLLLHTDTCRNTDHRIFYNGRLNTDLLLSYFAPFKPFRIGNNSEFRLCMNYHLICADDSMKDTAEFSIIAVSPLFIHALCDSAFIGDVVSKLATCDSATHCDIPIDSVVTGLLRARAYLHRYPRLLKVIGIDIPQSFSESFSDHGQFYYRNFYPLVSNVKRINPEHAEKILENLQGFAFWALQEYGGVTGLVDEFMFRLCKERGITLPFDTASPPSSYPKKSIRSRTPLFFDDQSFSDNVEWREKNRYPLLKSFRDYFIDLTVGYGDSLSDSTLWEFLCSSEHSPFEHDFNYFGYFKNDTCWRRVTLKPVLAMPWMPMDEVGETYELFSTLSFNAEPVDGVFKEPDTADYPSKPLFCAGITGTGKKPSEVYTGTRREVSAVTIDSQLVETIEYTFPTENDGMVTVTLVNRYADSSKAAMGAVNGQVIMNYDADADVFDQTDKGWRVTSQLGVCTGKHGEVQLEEFRNTYTVCGDGECDNLGLGIGTPYLSDLNGDGHADIFVRTSDGPRFYLSEADGGFEKYTLPVMK